MSDTTKFLPTKFYSIHAFKCIIIIIIIIINIRNYVKQKEEGRAFVQTRPATIKQTVSIVV